MTAQLLHASGRVLTMDDQVPLADAVLIREGRIAAVGSISDVERVAGQDANRIELDDSAVLLPGFIDAHHHYSLAVLDIGTPTLRLGRQGVLADLLEVVDKAVSEAAGDDPLRLFGYDHQELAEHRPPHRWELDEIAGDRPLLLLSASCHEAVLNTAGLRFVGIEDGSFDPPNGQLGRTRAGRLTGELFEAAAFNAEAIFRQEHLKDGPEAWLDACERHGRTLLGHGITRLADAAVPPSIEALYLRAAAEGRLPVTVHRMAVSEASMIEPRLEIEPTGSGPEATPIGPAKLFLDGAHKCAACFSIAQTVQALLMLTRVVVTGGGLGALRAARRAGNMRLGRDLRVRTGDAFWEAERLSSTIAKAADRDVQCAQHAVGNEAIALAVSALEPHADRLHALASPPRLEHVMFAERSLLRRMAGVGAVAVVQPGFIRDYGDGMRLTPFPSPIQTLAFRDMLEAGVPLAGSSDYPAGSPSVLAAIKAATTRRTRRGNVLGPHQAISVTAAIRAYTTGAAAALGVSDEVGSLSPGKRADLVVLSANPLQVAAHELSQIEVMQTWVHGRLAYESPHANTVNPQTTT